MGSTGDMDFWINGEYWRYGLLDKWEVQEILYGLLDKWGVQEIWTSGYVVYQMYIVQCKCTV